MNLYSTPVDVSEKIARHVSATRAEAIPANALEAARRSLLDAIGVSVAASGLAPECLPFVELARAERAAPVCSILGFGERTAPAAAVLANGALAHALDFEDAHDPSLCHPNAQVVPVLLALAQSEGGVRGGEFLAAMAVGCDLTCRLSQALGTPLADHGWYAPSLLGGFGAAAAAANLLRLDERRTLDAFSLLVGQLGSHGQIFGSTDSPMRGVRDAFPAHAALVSVLLAREGLRGFDRPFEGHGGLQAAYARGEGDLVSALEDLGERYAGEEVSFKPWPSCRATHAFVEAALELRGRERLQPAAIASVTLTGSPLATRIVAEPRAQKLRPGTIVEAKFSVFFTVALALATGKIALSSFTEATLDDPELLGLAGRIAFVADDAFGIDSGRVEVATTDGRTLAFEVAAAAGGPANPISDEALVAKFLGCTGYAAAPNDEASWKAFAARILTLEAAADVAAALDAI